MGGVCREQWVLKWNKAKGFYWGAGKNRAQRHISPPLQVALGLSQAHPAMDEESLRAMA